MWPSPNAKDIKIELLTVQVEDLKADLSSQRDDYEGQLEKEEARTRQEIQTSDGLRVELSGFQAKLLTKLMK